MSVNIDGINLKDIGIKAKLSSNIPLSPETRDKTVTIPDMHGAHYMGSDLEPLPLDIDCDMERNDMAEIQHATRELKRILLDQYGKPKEVKLLFFFEPNKWYYARYQGAMTIERLATMGKFTLPFTAYDPYVYSNVYADEINWGNEIMTFESMDYTFGHESLTGVINITSATTKNVTVTGYALLPILEISGSANGMSIENDGQVINFPDFTETNWVIDCEKYTVLNNGVNVFDDVKLRNFWLFTGENTLKINGSNIDIDLRVKFRDKWL